MYICSTIALKGTRGGHLLIDKKNSNDATTTTTAINRGSSCTYAHVVSGSNDPSVMFRLRTKRSIVVVDSAELLTLESMTFLRAGTCLSRFV